MYKCTVFCMKTITDKQQEVLTFIEGWIAEHGYSPSVREVALFFEVSVNAAAQHLRSLEQKNFLSRAAGKGRALTLVQKQRTNDSFFSNPLARDQENLSRIPRFPLVGTIPAGTPHPVNDDLPESFLELSPEWFGRGEMMAVTVRGDSMSGDLIGDGDTAILLRQVEAAPYDIVAVRVDGAEVTLKRMKPLEGGMVALVPSNPQYEIRTVDAEQIEVIGKLVTILRRF